MNNITENLRDELLCLGADLVEFGDISEIPMEERSNMPVGISVAVKIPKEIIRNISDLPTAEYRDWYVLSNERLDFIVNSGAKKLIEMGYSAIAQNREYVGDWMPEGKTKLPHKTIATRAGLGWIGKCALLVTEQYGSMVRLSSIITDAPLQTGTPINFTKCGDCMECTNGCPGGAVSGKPWYVKMQRDEFFDWIKCDNTAKERSIRGFGGGITVCGKCIELCPYAKRYMNS